MARFKRGRIPLLVIGAMALSTTAAFAAGMTLTSTNVVGGGEQTISSPCSSIAANYSPTYDATDQAYETNTITVQATCGAAGLYRLSMAVQTGASTFLEQTIDFNVAAPGTANGTVAFPVKIKASELMHISVLIVPKP